MTIDLGPVLLAAHEGSADWGEAQFRSELDRLSKFGGLRVDWDDGAGEGWGRLVHDGKVAIYVCRSVPFVLYEPQWSDVVAHSAAIAFEVSSVADPVLRCDVSLLGQIFGDPNRFNDLEPERFSADDLWFCTV